MRIYLITHAHTCQQPAVDCTRWVLSERGQAQAEQLSLEPFWPDVARIVLSTEPKTQLTVEPTLARYRLPVHVDARFDELRRGRMWLDSYCARVAEVFSRPDDMVGGWESAASARNRFVEGVTALFARYPNESVALVGHGLTLSLYRAHVLGQRVVDLADWQLLDFAAVAVVELMPPALISDFRPVAGHMPRGVASRNPGGA